MKLLDFSVSLVRETLCLEAGCWSLVRPLKTVVLLWFRLQMPALSAACTPSLAWSASGAFTPSVSGQLSYG